MKRAQHGDMDLITSHPPRRLTPRRLQVQAWLWGAIEVAALWRARWRRRGSGH